MYIDATSAVPRVPIQNASPKTYRYSKLQIIAQTTTMTGLTDGNGQNDNDQDHGQNQQQTTRLPPRTLLMPLRRPQFRTRSVRVIPRVLHIHTDDIQLFPLLVHHVADIAEELVQLADALLDIPDLGFPLDDELFLEVDFVLGSEA